ncbi:carboxypeptidase-like regulatory domain-containing protein [Lutibacter holmesii]|uniref:Carboxypeptidase-like regulatory domain-containing protein n=1 Tax=Lutibacter holmesii TaxID=1137985 RepID=A0ABW3WN70_9FLAO
MTRKITIHLLAFITSLHCISQTKKDTIQDTSQETVKLLSEIKGNVLDAQSKEPLPYTNIIIKNQNRGVISNEKGDFSLNILNISKTDSIWFQYIGYATKKITVNQLMLDSTILLDQDVYSMNEVFILSQDIDPKKIVKNVLENKEVNYVTSTQKNQTFIRTRYTTDIEKFDIEFQKSTFEEINKEMIDDFKNNVPKHSTSYSDFLGNVLISTNEDDELELKIDPIKLVSLKEEDIAELDKIEKLFDSLFKNTGEKEYWKIKSGLFGGKIDIPEETESDTLDENTHKIKYINQSIKYKLGYATFENKKKWEFLHKTGNYNYTVAGLTNVNGEDAYIIDFTPKSDGEYEGRLYISVETSALIRADYNYAPGKIGKDFQLLGIGYSETAFSGSIYFEKTNNTSYTLKYFSTKSENQVSINRKFALQKKQNKFLFDKNLNEIKARFKMIATNATTIEYMVIENENIPKTTFTNFKEQEKMKVIYVDQFDESLWKDYNIIEPTQQMKTYKKLQ